MALWSGRFAKKMSSAFSVMNASLPVDIRLLPYEVKQNAAYAKMLAEIDILTKAELSKILSGLKQIQFEYESEAYFPLPEDEDIHSLVERRLTEIAGDVGKKIHTGRSRNEEIITEIKMCLRDEIKDIRKNIKELISVLVKKARENQNVVMPGYTHLQHAQPVLLSHYFCSFGYVLKNDDVRLENILKSSLSSCPMGSGAFAGTAFPIDREKLARELGFEKPSENSITAVSQRDELLEVASALSIIMIHLSRYAEDLIVWSTNEFGFIELDESVSTGSSMMPQKKNPDSLELIRGKSARVIGNMQTLFTLMKGLPLTYSRDLQEDKRPLFDSIDETSISLSVFKEVIDTMTINRSRMEMALHEALHATDIADYLTKKGLPFREAHAVVAKIVREVIAEGTSLKKIKLKDLKKHSAHFEEDVFERISPAFSISAREILGGTGTKSVKHQIEELSKLVIPAKAGISRI